KQRNNPQLSTLNSIGYSVFTSRGAGCVLAFDVSVLLLPVCRNLIAIIRRTRINRIIPFDHNIYFHKCAAYMMMLFTLVHVNAHYTNFFWVEVKVKATGLQAWQVHYLTWAGSTGHLMLFIMIMMYAAAKFEVRKKNFEIFCFGCFVHDVISGKCFPYMSWAWAMPGFAIYFFERVIREYRARQYTTLTKVIFHPGNTMEIQFDKPSFQYKPGMYLFINIPEVSVYQWHPFTITSTPEEGFISIHIRLLGNWTNQAAKVLGCFKDGIDKSNLSKLPVLRIDGPFGAPAEDLYNYKVACLIGAGIGVTPAAALLKSIWYRHYRKAPMQLQKVYFFWVNRDKDAFEWFQSLLATIEASVPGTFLEIHVYLTGKLSVDDIQNIVLNDANELDPLTELQNRCHYGRPEWSKMFRAIGVSNQHIAAKDGGKLEVGVFFCGPTPLAHSIGVSCKEVTNDQITFTLRKEHF
ncbi:hypothetical protein HK099_000338, partial [Clydaea vesicula]